MRTIAHLIVLVTVNALSLWAATTYITGFSLDPLTPRVLAAMAFVFMLLNLIVKPLLKLILGPLIVLTLGLGLIAVNAIVLKILDFLFENLRIDSVLALVYATLLIGVVNIIFHLGTKPRHE